MNRLFAILLAASFALTAVAAISDSGAHGGHDSSARATAKQAETGQAATGAPAAWHR